MIRRLDPRTLAGGALVATGIASITAALIAAGPTPARAAAIPTTPVWLTIHLSDSAGGVMPQGSTVTITATVTNSSTTTVVTNTGVATTITANASADPTVSYNLSNKEVSFVSGGGGAYFCSIASGSTQPTCVKDGSIAAGSTDTQTLVVSVTGSPGDNANATASVNGAFFQPNLAGSSATATDHAFIANVGAYTNQAPAGCFPHKVGSDQQVTNQPLLAAAQRPRLVNGSQVFTFTDGTVTITVTVPPGALPNGTIVSLYAGNLTTCWNASVSAATSSHTAHNAYAVGWALSGSVSFTASSSIEISVSDTGVHSGDPLFGTNKNGLGSQIGTAASSNWTAMFTDDPGFVLAQAAAVTTPSSSTSASTTVSAPSGGGGPVARQASPVPLAMGILAIVGGAGLVGTRRRRRPE